VSQEPALERVVFRTSRMLDFVGKRELTAQIGHDATWWPLVILKELLDNAIDAAEEAKIAPAITVAVSTAPEAVIKVSDNGPGLAAETVAAILDYNVRVSSREAYVSPTRGQQGNALKTIIAMPYALDGGRGSTLIESRGVIHRINFSADQVRQVPRIEHTTERAGIEKNGTVIAVSWPRDSLPYLINAHGRFLQMAAGYAVLNPHLSLEVEWNGEIVVRLVASDATWQKWRACDPTSPHWYTRRHLARLAGAHIARDEDLGLPRRTVRAFVSEFHGLSSTAKQNRR
jgi:DNA topoisomerase VI subunit B